MNAYGKYDAKGVFRVFGTEADDHFEITFEPQYSMTDSTSGGSVIAGYSPKVNVNGNPLRILGKRWVAFPRPVRVYLGDGNDTLTITNPDIDKTQPTRFHIDGGSGDDSIDGGVGRDTILAGAGNDTVNANAGDDSIEGGSGADDLRAGHGRDTVYAGGGNDRIRPGGGVNAVYAGAGHDRIYSANQSTSGNSAAAVFGNAGNDTLFNGTARDEFVGGDGVDVVDYSSRAEELVIELRGSFNAPYEYYVDPLDPDPADVRNNRLRLDGRAQALELKVIPPFGQIDLGGTGRSQPTEPIYVKAFPPPNDQSALFGTGRLEGDSLYEVEVAIGGQNDDVLIGTAIRDILRGHGGNDTIFAGMGSDDCYGDDGDDFIFTVDTRDGMPTLIEDRVATPFVDLVDGGRGRDFARGDARDLERYRSNIESFEALRSLYQ